MEVVINNIAAVFLIMGVGFAANKTGMLPEEANKYLSPLLMKITTPCLILANIATREVEEGMWGDIFKALGCFALYFVVFCFLGWVLCAKMMKLKGHKDIVLPPVYCCPVVKSYHKPSGNHAVISAIRRSGLSGCVMGHTIKDLPKRYWFTNL